MPLSIIKALISRPKFAFQQIQQQQISGWIPFLLIIISLQLFWLIYFAQVDIQWLIADSLNSLAAQASPSEQQALAEQLTPELIRYSSHISSSLMLILQTLLVATYLNIATKLDSHNTDTLKDWFGFYWWVQLPTVAQLLLSVIVLWITGSNQFNLYDLQVTSINQILGLQAGDALFSFAATFDVFSVWSFILMFYGLSVKTQLKSSTIINICVIPVLITLSFSYVFS
ncbi:YIP1 family protein [Catenovulum adriaticum]|uniref:YIP1 family protein n=1 Tax=Catenovulum adriaticum TaxID=2984846 RepID=A0ABY7AKV9_9ALTE|nr:YIP1 family protein [Catenovulum sp. TS8]WAJ68974.1 YIP1 family protein [Catenovulum sp. TS8]